MLFFESRQITGSCGALIPPKPVNTAAVEAPTWCCEQGRLACDILFLVNYELSLTLNACENK